MSVRISVLVNDKQSLTPSLSSTYEDRARFKAVSAGVNAFFFFSLANTALADLAAEEVDCFSSLDHCDRLVVLF